MGVGGDRRKPPRVLAPCCLALAVLGPAGVELCSGVLAASSPASLLRLPRKRVVRRVSGLEPLFGCQGSLNVYATYFDGELSGVASSSRGAVYRMATKPVQLPVNQKPCYISTASPCRWSCPHHRRHPEKSSPDFMGHVAGRAVFGSVAGSGPPSFMGVSRFGFFFRGRTKPSPRRPA